MSLWCVSSFWLIPFYISRTLRSGHPIKFPAAMALSHVDLIGYPHTACIHFIPRSVDGRSYTLLACSRARWAFLDGVLGCHCPLFWMSGLWYRPCSLCTPMSIGSPLHLMSTSVSLCKVTPVLVKIEMVPLSEVFPTLINDVGKLVNVSACVTCVDSCGKGSRVTCFALHVLPLATLTHLFDEGKMGISASFLFFCSHNVHWPLCCT